LLNDEQRRLAWKESYGTEEYPAVKFDEADVILSLDSDFLVNEGNSVENIRKYSAKREVVNGTSFNRFYAAEGRLSATGAMADYRLRISPAEQLDFVMFLISKLLANNSSVSLDANVINKINKFSNAKFAGANKEIIDHLLKDLNENKGKAIVYAGDTLSKDVHTAVNLLNEIIGGTSLYDIQKYLKHFTHYPRLAN
jgi:molybdopterin-containing oxidoreductase family iron-sulfur binding subunit